MPDDRPDAAPAPAYPIESVGRTLALLEYLASRDQVRLVDVCEYLGIAHSTAHRMMAMLVNRDFAVQIPGSRAYRAGPAIFGLAAAARGSVDLREAARPVLRWLAQESGETAHLGTLTCTEVRYVDVIESAAALRVTGRVGRISPAHTTSLGKSMLACLSDEEVTRRYDGLEFEQNTELTIRSLDQLFAELRRTRRRGWARNRNELASGVWSVGMSIPFVDEGIRAALSIATPQARSSSSLEQKHAHLLTEATQRLLRAL